MAVPLEAVISRYDPDHETRFAPARGLTEFHLPLTGAYIERHLNTFTKRASLGDNALKRAQREATW